MPELLPSPEELINTANTALQNIMHIQTFPIFGNLIKREDSNTFYIGNVFFNSVPKHTKNSKSKEPNDFSGLYIFYENNIPVYVGISNTIIRRIRYHLTRRESNESSFVFLMAKSLYQIEHGKPFIGKRKEFPFSKYREAIQTEMINNWNFSYYPLKGEYNLSFTEIYVAAGIKTKWNSFGTH